MADYIVTSTADSGSGSLREGLAQIRNGETITFDDSLEDENGVITIELAADSAALDLPAYTFTIEGGSHAESGETLKTRVVIDAAASSSDFRRVATCANSSNPTINNVTFKNGYQYTSNYGGGLLVTYRGDVVLNYCVFDTCHAMDAGAIVFLNTAKGTINNCYFYNCDAVIGGVSEIRNTSAVVFNNCVFDKCFASSNGNVIYTTGTPSATINNCVFLPVTNNTKTTIYNGGTNANGSLIIKGSNAVDIATFAASSTVVFDGVDSVLTITTTFSGASAIYSVTTDSTGYLALPVGVTVPTVGTGIKTATYGAGVSYVNAQIDGVEYVASSPTTPVLIEKQTGSTWTTLTDSAIDGAYATTLDAGDIIRVFDGVHFVSDDVSVIVEYWRVYNYAANTNGGGTDSDGNRIGAWSVESYALATNGGGYDPDSGSDLPGWTVANYALTPNLEEAENENQ